MFGFFSKLSPFSFGRKGEDMAVKELKKNGYKILQRNFSCKAGEIDIIASQDDFLVFCEVKARRSDSFGSALESITPAKIKKIRKTADIFLLKNRITNKDCRFDVVTIDEKDSKREIKIIPNAF